VGGNLELGPLPGPVTLAIETASGLSCGRVTWTSERTVGRGRRRAIRKLSTGPLGSCLPPTDGVDRIPPLVTITSPTAVDGTTLATPTITPGGLAPDNVGVTALTG